MDKATPLLLHFESADIKTRFLIVCKLEGVTMTRKLNEFIKSEVDKHNIKITSKSK